MINFQKSKKELLHLEISVQVGCGMMCEYCPQTEYIKRYKELFDKRDKLSYEYFLFIADNIPIDTVIHWTGFTEPFDCVDFELISRYLYDRGHKQLISTTLYGRKSNQSFFVENLKMFSGGISLHLPDDSGLMKGSFDDQYVNYVDSVLKQLISIDDINYSLFLIGEQFHPKIKLLLDYYLEQIPQEKIIKAKYLNTRNKTVKPMNYNLLSSESEQTKEGSFYCSYRRLNQGVLLPNGSIVLCCQDYNLDMNLGSLEEFSLEEIYHVIEKDSVMANDFCNGNFYPCTKCEHYKNIEHDLTTDRK